MKMAELHPVPLTLLHSEIPKLYTILAFLSAIGYTILAFLSAIGLKETFFSEISTQQLVK